MRVLVCNHRYFISGGPERYMFRLMRLLERQGHTTVPFSIDYEKNIPTEYSRYFISPPAGRGQVFFGEKPLGTGQKLRMLGKTLYNLEARRKAVEVIKAERIDIAYTIQCVNYMYQGIVDGATSVGVPVVCRLSDFQLMCPSYHFFKDGRPCEDCKGGYYHAMKKPCMQGSKAVTSARVASMYLQRLLGTHDKVSAFVAPSRFMRDKLVEYGFPGEKVNWAPTFIELETMQPEFTPGGYALYVGNVREHKGVDSLLRACQGLGFPLKIAGISAGREAESLMSMVRGYGLDNVEFLGFKDKDELAELYRNASFAVVPSEWYENTPNVILEAMAYGKPVIGSEIGCIPEMVRDGQTGLTFRPGDADDMREKMQAMFYDADSTRRMGEAARKMVESEYSPERHYMMLNEIFERVAG